MASENWSGAPKRQAYNIAGDNNVNVNVSPSFLVQNKNDAPKERKEKRPGTPKRMALNHAEDGIKNVNVNNLNAHVNMNVKRK